MPYAADAREVWVHPPQAVLCARGCPHTERELARPLPQSTDRVTKRTPEAVAALHLQPQAHGHDVIALGPGLRLNVQYCEGPLTIWN